MWIFCASKYAERLDFSMNMGIFFISKNKYKLFYFLALIILFNIYFYYINLAKPLVPYMDSIRYIWLLNDLLTGNKTIFELWHQNGSVGLLYQLVTLFEWVFWGLDTRITVTYTAIVWLLIFSVYIVAWSNLYINEPNKKRKDFSFFMLFLSGLYFISPAGWEIYLLDLGFAQTIKNLLIILFLYYLSLLNYQACSVKKLNIIGIFGGLLILFATYGWSYPFTVTIFILVLLSNGFNSSVKYKGLYIVFPVMIGQIIYVIESAGVILDTKAITFDLVGLTSFILGVMYGLTSVFIGSETLHSLHILDSMKLLFGALFFSFLLFIIYISIKSKSKDKSVVFFISLIVFGLSTLAVISVSRGGQGYEFVGAPRYFMDYQFIFIGFILLTITQYLEKSRVKTVFVKDVYVNKIITTISLIYILFAIVGQTITYIDEYRKAPYRAALYQQQSLVYLLSDVSDANAKLLQTNIDSLGKAIAVSDSFNLASLRNFDGECKLSDALTMGDFYAKESTGVWLGKEGVLIIGNCPQKFNLYGYLPNNFSKRTLTIEHNKIITNHIIVPGESFSIMLNNGDYKNIIRVKLFIDHVDNWEQLKINDKRDLGVFITKVGK